MVAMDSRQAKRFAPPTSQARNNRTKYSYDRQNMLTRVEDAATSSLTEQYKYDALGRRIVADGGTNVVRFYHSGNQIIEETNGSDTVQRTYVWGPIYIDELILFEDTAGNGGTAGAGYFALRHHNYNVVALADSSGTIVERYDYNPYGQRFVLNADFSADADGLSDYANSIGHQGLHHDTATGLVYNRARMLAPVLGRFMQRDPMGYVDGMNLYGNVRSNPLENLDPTGLFCLVIGHKVRRTGSTMAADYRLSRLLHTSVNVALLGDFQSQFDTTVGMLKRKGLLAQMPTKNIPNTESLAGGQQRQT